MFLLPTTPPSSLPCPLSCAGPVVAGIFSLINDALLNAGKPSLGLVNPALYKAAAEAPNTFRDVVIGSNRDGDLQDPGSGFPTFCKMGFDAVPGCTSCVPPSLCCCSWVASHGVVVVCCCCLQGTPSRALVPRSLCSCATSFCPCKSWVQIFTNKHNKNNGICACCRHCRHPCCSTAAAIQKQVYPAACSTWYSASWSNDLGRGHAAWYSTPE